jgi:peptidoglycan-N-acetylglucosamine deacetylase
MRFFRSCLFTGILYPKAIFRRKTSEKILYLTFDDGPDPESTPELLDILDNHNVKALFFCTGIAAEKYPELIEKIKCRGHLIGNHGYSHLNGWETSIKKYCNDTQLASSFTSENLFRPPYGRLRIRQYRKLQRSFRIFFWDIMPYDYDKKFGSRSSFEILNKKIRPGSVIALHDRRDSTSKIYLGKFLNSSIEKGFRFQLP